MGFGVLGVAARKICSFRDEDKIHANSISAVGRILTIAETACNAGMTGVKNVQTVGHGLLLHNGYVH